MKQTAVEWLVEQIKSDQNQRVLLAKEWMEVIEQAKEMEKEQMNLSEIKGISNTINYKNSIAEISDEEIEKAAEDWQEFRQGAGKQSFEQGCKWYREQLKQK